jgi:hypothetical protein
MLTIITLLACGAAPTETAPVPPHVVTPTDTASVVEESPTTANATSRRRAPDTASLRAPDTASFTTREATTR